LFSAFADCVTSGAGTRYPPGTPEFTHGFKYVD
jgi:hypothetical protein